MGLCRESVPALQRYQSGFILLKTRHYEMNDAIRYPPISMKLSTRLNLSILLFLVIPLTGALLWLTVYSSDKLRTEAQTKLAADLKVARLMLQHEINEFQNLAAAAATHQGLGILVEYELHQKLDRQLQSIQQNAPTRYDLSAVCAGRTPTPCCRSGPCRIVFRQPGWTCVIRPLDSQRQRRCSTGMVCRSERYSYENPWIERLFWRRSLMRQALRCGSASTAERLIRDF